MTRLALFGPPGAGKGTQAERLARQHDLTAISTGDLLRKAIQSESALGREADSYIAGGRLVPDRLVCALAEHAIEGLGFDAFILDGYPRTVNQARLLDRFLGDRRAGLQALLCLRIPDAEIIRRLSGRCINRETGESYHLEDRPPPADVDPDLIVRRDDDCPVAIRQRLESYRMETSKVEAHYARSGILVEVNGFGTIADVNRRLDVAVRQTAILNKPAKKAFSIR